MTNRTTHQAIEVTSIVPGEPDIQNSYRSELTGLLALLQLIWDLCQEFDIKSGACTIVCDSKGALNKIFSTSTNTLRCSSLHADIVAACVRLIEIIPIQLYPQHVKAHQDDVKEFEELTDFKKLNVPMDKKTKIALKQSQYSDEEIELFENHPLSYHTQ